MKCLCLIAAKNEKLHYTVDISNYSHSIFRQRLLAEIILFGKHPVVWF